MEWSYVFVSHSTEDFELVDKLAEAMGRIGIRPFLSEYYMTAGNEIAKKIKDAIQDCNCFVPILTKNSVRSQWVNQEIGYVYGTREHGREIYPIPVVEKGLEINGFINKNTEYIELDHNNLEYVTYLLLKRLREYINRYLPELDQVFITCKLCGNDYTLSLPNQKDINNAIEKGQVFPSKCKRCNTQNNLSPMTFDIKEHFKLAS